MISTNKRPIEPIPYTILSNAQEEEIKWLWNPYIPGGALSTIIGDGGYGKSFMTCAIAADLSAGRPLPGQEAMQPQRILMLSAEDGLGPVIVPRLKSLDANLENIAVYDEGFALNPEMTQRIMLAVQQFDATIVFLDPLVVYLGGEIDIFKANEVRSILSQLSAIAKRCNIAIVGVHHVKKGSATSLQHKSSGSADLVNGVRSTLLVDVSKGGQYYMRHVKHNWSKEGPPLAYAFNGDKFRWLGTYGGRMEEDDDDLSFTPRGKARSFLIAMLKEGPVLANEILKMGMDEGLSERSLQNAKKGLVHSMRRDEKWYWQLHVEPPPEVIDETPDNLLAAMAGEQQDDQVQEILRAMGKA